MHRIVLVRPACLHSQRVIVRSGVRISGPVLGRLLTHLDHFATSRWLLIICIARDFLHLTAASLLGDSPGEGHGLVADLASRNDPIIHPAGACSFVVAVAAIDQLKQVHLVLVKGEVLLHRAKLGARRYNLPQRSLFDHKGITLLILLHHSLSSTPTILICLIIDSQLTLPRTLPDQLQKHLIILIRPITKPATFNIILTEKALPFDPFASLFIRII